MALSRKYRETSTDVRKSTRRPPSKPDNSRSMAPPSKSVGSGVRLEFHQQFDVAAGPRCAGCRLSMTLERAVDRSGMQANAPACCDSEGLGTWPTGRAALRPPWHARADRHGRSKADVTFHQVRWLVPAIHPLGTPWRTVCERLHRRARGCATDSGAGVRGAAAYEFPRALSQDHHDWRAREQKANDTSAGCR